MKSMIPTMEWLGNGGISDVCDVLLMEIHDRKDGTLDSSLAIPGEGKA
jgi:hypothetical protein